MVLDRGGYEIWEDRNPARSVEKASNPRYWGDGKPGNEVDGPWQRLFIDCIKQDRQAPIDFEQSHQATVCCHLANIAYLSQQKIEWDGPSESITGNDQAAARLERPRRDPYGLPAV
jgi:hypothetical protein